MDLDDMGVSKLSAKFFFFFFKVNYSFKCDAVPFCWFSDCKFLRHSWINSKCKCSVHLSQLC